MTKSPQSQSRLFAAGSEKSARALSAILELEFEEEGYPVAAFENPDDDRIWEVSVYVDTEIADDTQLRIEKLLEAGGHKAEFQNEELPNIDWVAETLRELAPVRAGRFIVHGSHDRYAPYPHEVAVWIDASVAFGSGHHGTTAGCLDMLDRELKRHKFRNILDLGTGSGVLAIAAAKATNAKVLASDYDPVATKTAEYNTRRNGVASKVTCITADGFCHPAFKNSGRFDLIIANILARPLQRLAVDVSNHMAVGGTLILSGLLPHQKAPLIASYRLQGLAFLHAHYRDGWLSLVMRKT